VNIQQLTVNAKGIRLSVEQDGKEVAHAYLYLMTNALHETPFGLMKDVCVDEIMSWARSWNGFRPEGHRSGKS